MNNATFRFPTYLVKGVATSGHYVDLGPLQIGVFDKQTSNVATATGNGKEFFLAGGSPHTRDNLSKFYSGMQSAKKSSEFYGKDIKSFEKVYPGRPQNEEWVLGYGGGQDDVSLGFEKGKIYQLKIRLYGEPAFSRFNKSLEKIITLPSQCNATDPCTDNCADQTAEIKAQTIRWVKLINENVELSEFKLKAYPVFSDFSATAANAYVYHLSVSDNGDVDALQAVQRAYAANTYGSTITRYSYNAGVSVYEVKGLASAPGNFTPTSSVLLSLCGDACASGYAASPEQDVYMISRPLAGSEDLSTSNLQQTFADTVAAAYLGQNFNATTGVDDTTETITITAHGYSDGQAVVPSVVSGLIVTGLVAGTTYYVRDAAANTFKLAATRGGTAINLTDAVGVNRLTPAGQTFLNQTGAVANIKVIVPAGVTVTALLSDSVVELAGLPATCTPSAPSAIAWTQFSSGYTSTRTLTATFSDEECVSYTTTMIEAALAVYPSYVAASVSDVTDVGGTDTCVKRFTITQKSNFQEDLCMSPDVAVYADDIISFQGVVFVADDIDYGDTTAVKAGIRFTAPFYSVKFDDCSFNPNEYYDYKPLQMEVSIWDQNGDVCSLGTQAKARRVKQAEFSRLTGEFVRRDLIRGSVYFKYEDWNNDPRFREVIDNTLLQQVSPSKYYVQYFLKFKTSQDKERDQAGEWFEPVLYVEEGDLATQLALETAIQKISAKWGVVLEERVY